MYDTIENGYLIILYIYFIYIEVNAYKSRRYGLFPFIGDFQEKDKAGNVQVLSLGFSLSYHLAVRDEFFKSGVLVDPECGGSVSWNIYIARETGICGSRGPVWNHIQRKRIKALRIHAVRIVSDGKKNKTWRGKKKKYLDLKFISKPRHGKGK